MSNGARNSIEFPNVPKAQRANKDLSLRYIIISPKKEHIVWTTLYNANFFGSAGFNPPIRRPGQIIIVSYFLWVY